VRNIKVYYDKKIDQLVLVQQYKRSGLYIYMTDILFRCLNVSPGSFESLEYIGTMKKLPVTILSFNPRG
jgi:hypothetical protein